jgi:hypothetical protein
MVSIQAVSLHLDSRRNVWMDLFQIRSIKPWKTFRCWTPKTRGAFGVSTGMVFREILKQAINGATETPVDPTPIQEVNLLCSKVILGGQSALKN